MEKEIDVWSLWDAMFQVGDPVVVITDDDRYLWGQVSWTPMAITVKRSGHKAETVSWDEVRFVAHDGFPVKKLRGADGSSSIEKENTSELVGMIRGTLGAVKRDEQDARFCPRCKRLYPEEAFEAEWPCDGLCVECDKLANPWRYDEEGTRAIFGDPWLIEDVNVVLVNAGIVWDDADYEYEETLVLRHKGGARGMLWDIPTIYMAEVA